MAEPDNRIAERERHTATRTPGRLSINLLPRPAAVIPELEEAITAPDDVEPVALPPAEPPRPRRARSVGRRRIGVASVLGLLIVGAAVLASWLIYSPEEEPAETAAAAAPAANAASLIAVTDETGRAASILLVAAEEGSDATVVVLPPALVVELPGFGPGELGDATVLEGPELLRLAIVNELGVRVDGVAVFGPGDVAALAGGPIRVDLSDPLIVEQGDGDSRVLAGPGSNSFTPETAERLMLTQGTSSRLEWLRRQQSVWEALMVNLGEDPAPLVAALGDGPGTQTVSAALAEGVVFRAMPMRQVGAVGQGELFALSGSAGDEFIAEELGYVQLAAARPRVELLNGNGQAGVTRPVAEVLIEEGYNLVNTGNADRADYLDSLIIAQGDANQTLARELRDLIGVGEVVLDRRDSAVVDISIIIGADIADAGVAQSD